MTTNELLDRYLSGAITAPQEAELERRAASDPVLAEALAGLQGVPEEDHAARVSSMLSRARSQGQGKDKKAKIRPLGRYAAAAAVALLVVAALFMLPEFTGSTSGDLALQTEAPANDPNPSPEPRARSVPVPEAVPEDVVAGGADDQRSEPSVVSVPPPVPSSPSPDPSVSVRDRQRPRPEPQVEEAAVPAADEPAMEEEVEMATEAPAPAMAESSAPPPPPVTPIAREQARREAAEIARREAEKAAARRRTRGDSGNFNAPVAPAASRATYITGRITNDNGEPIPGALVRLPGLPLGERTDTAGVFRLDADATASRIDISHPDFESESVEIGRRRTDLQLTLEERDNSQELYEQAWAPTKIPLGSGRPGMALPEEGYNALRRRIEAGKPEGIPAGKVKLSFIVNPDGTMEDFVFRGTPSQETMDYIGGTIVRTSIWNVIDGEEPVRVYFKVVFE